MKKELLLISLFFGLASFSQPPIKVFAFEQDNFPGTKPAVTDENGNPVRKVATRKNYFIYLSFNKSYNIRPSHVFVKGKLFTIKTMSLRNTPIEHVNSNIPNQPEKIVLVPATTNKVLQLKLNESEGLTTTTNSIKKLTEKNDVVVEYSWKNKTYFATIQKLKTLEPVFNE